MARTKYVDYSLPTSPTSRRPTPPAAQPLTLPSAQPRPPAPHCPTGLPHCIACLAEHSPTPDSPFCSDACAATYWAARRQENARRKLFERDLGVCQVRACLVAGDWGLVIGDC